MTASPVFKRIRTNYTILRKVKQTRDCGGYVKVSHELFMDFYRPKYNNLFVNIFITSKTTSSEEIHFLMNAHKH